MLQFLKFLTLDTVRLSICLTDACHVTNRCLFFGCFSTDFYVFLLFGPDSLQILVSLLVENTIMFLSKLTLRSVTAATKHCRVVVSASSVHAVHRRFLHEDNNSKNSSDCGTEKASNKDADLLSTPRREGVRNILRSKPSNQLFQAYVSN